MTREIRNTRIQRIMAIILCLIMAVGLTACGEKKQATNDKSDTVIITDNNFPVTIVDQAGREVVIEKKPEKLVSGYYISTSLLIALGVDDRLVGVENDADKRPIYGLAAEDILNLPSVGSVKEFDLEGCAALNPDLVILPSKLVSVAQNLEDLEITTIYVNPESEELLREMIDIVSKATGSEAKGEELGIFISDTRKMLTDKLSDAEGKTVYLAGNSDYLRTAGSKMYQSDLISLAGGKNVAAEIEDDYWVDIDYEQLLTWNSEYIFIAAAASYSVEDILEDENLNGLQAVIDKNVYKFPSDIEAWDSPIPGGILGSVWMSSILYSDVISSEERDALIEEYYERFYDFKYQR